MKKIVVAGTGTDVGKTYFSALLMKKLSFSNSIYIKPIQTGSPEFSDEAFVQEFSNCTCETILKYSKPCSPHLAALLDKELIDFDKLTTKLLSDYTNYENVVYELAGGVMVPINEHYTNLDLIHGIDPDEIFIVSHASLGTLNHTLLTIMALDKIGIDKTKITIVLNFVAEGEIDYIVKDNINYLSKFTNVIVVKKGQQSISL